MKKLLSTILTVVMCLLLAAPTWAANTSSSKCGTNLTWALDDKGTLTVSGTGAMDDYDMYSILPPWDGLKDKIKEVVIGNGVTTIGLSAFPGCSNLSSIKIGEGLKTIKQELANATNSVEISDNFETTYNASYNEDELSL